MFDLITLRESTLAKEGPLLVSKALKMPILLAAEEMEDLFSTLEKEAGNVGIYFAHGLCKKGEGKISKRYFLKGYADYISYLKKGQLPPIDSFRSLFSSFLSVTHAILYAIVPEEGLQLIKSTRPVVQMQLNHIHFSKEDGTFRPMVFGSDSISWGIQFSYPQLFQDPKTQEIYPIRETPFFPNTQLFKIFQRWNRQSTIPTPFVVEGKKVNAPIRIGKQCLNWINCHPQLVEKGIYVG